MTNAKFKQVQQEVEPAKPRRELSPFSEMERFFDEFLPRRWMSRRAADFPDWPEFRMQSSIQSPRVDVIDRDNEVVVRAEMPGMEKDAINISLTESAVTISGETKKEEREEEDNYYRCEIAQGSFSRIIRLPADVDGEKSKARFSDGILELTLPKTERTKRTDLKIEG